MLLLHDPVQPYDWGPVDGLVPLVGSEPSGGTEAELWVGAHPKAPSTVVGDGPARTLAEAIAEDPIGLLGDDLVGEGVAELPFLLKVLAIGRPLSLQAHPSADQARAGFEREEQSGIARDAPDRTYRDASPKPEALVALVPTWALCGFREPEDARERVAALAVPELAPLVDALSAGGAGALRAALSWLLGLEGGERSGVADALARSVSMVDADDRADPRAWARRLVGLHPGDPTALAPLLLELVHLAPGGSVHLPAGNLHAYLEGAGIEIMAASDNVLRGGLTSKHVDVAELLAVLRFEPGVPPGPTRTEVGPGVVAFDAGEAAFGLVQVVPGDGEVVVEPTGPSLLLATGGPVDVAGPSEGVVLDRGDGAFVAPGEGPLAVSGPGTLWWATTGDALPT
jgi:mannose-6-phosphate isomerase